MRKFNLYFFFPFAALILLIVVCSTSMYKLPPLGKFLNPVIGINHNFENDDPEAFYSNKVMKGIDDKVEVLFDERKVPHIFTKSDADLYYAQGYVTASLRLWQMDFLSYVSAGRLSEVFGESMLTQDRKQRRIGVLSAARKSLKLIESDPETLKFLNAYTKGVNAFIQQLAYKDYPFEYKFFDYAPEPWTNLKTVLIMKHMGNVLSGYEEDISMTKLYMALGREDFLKLYPDYNNHIKSIEQDQVTDTKELNYDRVQDYLKDGFMDADGVLPKSNYNPKLGSNNWVVSGKKTKSGFPILCNDVHLNLSLPSLWIDMQLVSDHINVYGVTLPGIPSIIIGFNKDLAWGVTNGAVDVKDWYKLKISSNYKKYEFDGKMVDFKYEVEEIKIKGKESFHDTVRYTIHGPVVTDNQFKDAPELANYALKWGLLSPSNELRSFMLLNKAKNKQDFLAAIKNFTCPVQNFIFSTKTGDIGIIHQGKIAKKWIGQGRFVLDGTRKDHLYSGYIAQDSLPQLYNPKSNFIFSANQHPTKKMQYSYTNGYYSEVRANRISKLLESGDQFDIAKMKAMQLDNVNAFAAEALSAVSSIIRNKVDKTPYAKEFEAFAKWNGNYNASSTEAELFELFWKNVKENTWDELKRYPFYLNPPDNYVLLDMIVNDPGNKYFDKQGTAAVETASDIVYYSFINAVASRKASDKLKPWSMFNTINIMHPTDIRSLGRYDIPMPGHSDAINALSKNWGASWRMIVEFGEDGPHSYGIYPGGQSGNIGSAHYEDYVNTWIKGGYYKLNFYLSKKEAKKILRLSGNE